jgi:hypothetical protein
VAALIGRELHAVTQKRRRMRIPCHVTTEDCPAPSRTLQSWHDPNH